MREEASTTDPGRDRNRQWTTASAPRMRQIVPGLFLGNVEASHNRAMLEENHINAIVSLTDARWVWRNSTTRNAGIPEDRHKWIQCVDSSTQDLLVHISGICDFIDQMTSTELGLLSSLSDEDGLETGGPDGTPSGAILVHCDLGISRSPTIIVAYLMRKLGMQRADVVSFVQSKQRIKPSSNFMRQLQIWGDVGYQVWEDEGETVPKALYRGFLEDRAALLAKKGLTGNEPLAPLSL